MLSVCTESRRHGDRRRAGRAPWRAVSRSRSLHRSPPVENPRGIEGVLERAHQSDLLGGAAVQRSGRALR
jgi:hypothetical protein